MAQLKSTIINGNLTVTGDILNSTGQVGFVQTLPEAGNHHYYLGWYNDGLTINVDETRVLKIPPNYGDTTRGETKFYSAVYAGFGTNYIYISNIANYSLINAYNGDWDSAMYVSLGIAYQNDHYVLFFKDIVPKGQPIRITSVWRRND